MRQQKGRYLHLCLSDTAKEAFRDLPDHAKTDYDRAVTLLRAKYDRPDVASQALSQLMQRGQHSSESIDQYASELKKLSRKACPHMDHGAVDLILKEIFMKGILQRYQKDLCLRNPGTFDDAVDTANNIESALSDVDSSVVAQATCSKSSQSKQIDELVKSVNDLVQIVKKGHSKGSSAAVSTPQSYFYPQIDCQGYHTFPEYSSYPQTFEQGSNLYCADCRKVGHDTLQQNPIHRGGNPK